MATMTKKQHDTQQSAPEIMPVNWDQIPERMRVYSSWVMWKYQLRDGKWAKVPQKVMFSCMDGATRTVYYQNISMTKPKLWQPWNKLRANNWAMELFADQLVGLGFCISANDPFCAIDLDHCRNPETGEIADYALKIIEDLNSYTELSTTGTGVHIYIVGKKPGLARCRRNGVKVEIYDDKRFVALTGNHLPGTPTDVEERQEELEKLYFSVFHEEVGQPVPPPRRVPVCYKPGEKPAEPAPAYCPPTNPVGNFRHQYLDDWEVLNRAQNAKNGSKFQRLWSGDTRDHDDDESSADFALASTLAFWCGRDEAQIERLMWQSGLRREKWNRKDGYLSKTIANAIAVTRNCYGDGSYSKPSDDSAEPVEHDEAIFDSLAAMMEELAADQPPLSPEQQERASQAAEDAARRIASERRDLDTYHCDDTRNVILHDTKEDQPEVHTFRCEKWTCPGCRKYLINRELLNISARLIPCGSVYERCCSEEEWATIRRRILRAKGQYYRIWDETHNAWYVVSSSHVAGAGIVLATVAVGSFRTILNEHQGDYRPCSTSHGWALPKPDKESHYRLCGLADPRLTIQNIQDIAEANNATYDIKHPEDQAQKTTRIVRFKREEGWTEVELASLHIDLFIGEHIPLQAWSIKPPTISPEMHTPHGNEWWGLDVGGLVEAALFGTNY